MNEAKFASLSADLKRAIDDTTGLAMVNRFGEWWNRWDQAGLDAVKARGHTIVSVSNDTREKWRGQLRPVIDQELADLDKGGIANARQIYDAMLKQVARFAK